MPPRARNITAQAAVRIALAACVLLTAGGCESTPDESNDGQVVRRDPPPTYAEIARLYNPRLEALDRMRARANVRLRYRDDDGEWKEEQPEGLLQIVRPDRLALSLGKASSTLYWFGCDDKRYWWLDLNEKPKRARVGTRTPDGAAAREQLGVSVAPWDLVYLLGIVPLDERLSTAASAPGAAAAAREAGGGTTAWSADGAMVVVTAPIGDAQPSKPLVAPGPPRSAVATSRTPAPTAAPRGFQRLWIDPKDGFPSRIEILDPQGAVLVVSELSGDERAEIRSRPVGARPRLPSQVYVHPADSEAEIRLTLTDVRDGPIVDDAFKLKDLLENFSIDDVNVEDLDARKPGAVRSPSQPTASIPSSSKPKTQP